MNLTFYFFSLFVLTAEAETTRTLRFEELKNLVESRNERVRSKSKDVEAATRREGVLLRSFLPTVEVYAGQETFKKSPLSEKTQPTYGAEARVNLFNGGRDRIENDKRKLITLRKRYESARAFSDELAKAREFYWHILYLRDFIVLINDTKKNSSESLKSAERRIRAGVGTETDRVEFEMYDIDLKRELERAELEYQNEIRRLTVLIDFDPAQTIEFPEELSHEHDWEEGLTHTEQDHSFLIKTSEIKAQEIQLEARQHRRAWLPKLEAFAAYNQFNQREEEDYSQASDRQETVVGLRLSMNLFDGLSNQREASALGIESQAAEADAKFARKELRVHLKGEFAELRLLHSQVHAAEDNVRRAEKYYRLTQSEYGRGVKNSPDVVGALEKLTSMKQKRLEIVRDFQISKSHVLAKLGK